MTEFLFLELGPEVKPLLLYLKDVRIDYFVAVAVVVVVVVVAADVVVASVTFHKLLNE